MRLSTKSRFAVTAMIDMGLRQHQGPVSLAAISQRQHISISYLEQIFSNMRQQGLVESTRGPGGGWEAGGAEGTEGPPDVWRGCCHPAYKPQKGGKRRQVASDPGGAWGWIGGNHGRASGFTHGRS